jgi:predicted DNA-binding transcriptional regulator AlpA
MAARPRGSRGPRRNREGLNPRALSIRSFCLVYDISPATFFRMQREGWGPKVMKIGHKSLISMEAADEWRQERERTSNKGQHHDHTGKAREHESGD